MKTFVTTCILSLSLASYSVAAQKSALAEKHKIQAVPAGVKAVFEKENPETEARWKQEETNYRAEYIDASNIAHVRVYDKDGGMIYRDDVMESFPAPIQNHYNSKYPGEGFVTWSRIDHKGVLSYYTYRNSEILWFDKDGKFQSPKNSKSKFSDSISVVAPEAN